MGGSTDNPSCIPTQQHHYTHLSSPSSSVPFSSYHTSSTGERRSGGDEDWGSGSRGFRAISSPGFDPAGSFRPREMPPELEFDAHGSESEDGVGLLEEPAKPSSLLRGSGSKRSRAAEVHNMSEKRRRSRINEKMKALQNLIPNSNKTDKASMLDEAIEYLKHLQLQVQMLSMRNGLNLHPLYMHGALSPQLNMGFAVDNGSATNIDVGVPPPLHLDSSARNLYGLSDTSSHPPIIQPCVTRMTAPGTSFGMEPSHSHHGPFQLPVSDEIFTEDMVPAGRLDSGRSTRNLQENEMKSMTVAAAALHVEGGMLGRERPEDNKLFIQHLHGLRVGSSFASEDVKPRSPEF